jgi:hypothetical protein
MIANRRNRAYTTDRTNRARLTFLSDTQSNCRDEAVVLAPLHLDSGIPDYTILQMKYSS